MGIVAGHHEIDKASLLARNVAVAQVSGCAACGEFSYLAAYELMKLGIFPVERRNIWPKDAPEPLHAFVVIKNSTGNEFVVDPFFQIYKPLSIEEYYQNEKVVAYFKATGYSKLKELPFRKVEFTLTESDNLLIDINRKLNSLIERVRERVSAEQEKVLATQKKGGEALATLESKSPDILKILRSGNPVTFPGRPGKQYMAFNNKEEFNNAITALGKEYKTDFRIAGLSNTLEITGKLLTVLRAIKQQSTEPPKLR